MNVIVNQVTRVTRESEMLLQCLGSVKAKQFFLLIKVVLFLFSVTSLFSCFTYDADLCLGLKRSDRF